MIKCLRIPAQLSGRAVPLPVVASVPKALIDRSPGTGRRRS